MVLPTDDSNARRCDVCGESNPPDRALCRGCGAPLRAPDADLPAWLPQAGASGPAEAAALPGWLVPAAPGAPSADTPPAPAWLPQAEAAPGPPAERPSPVIDEPVVDAAPPTPDEPAQPRPEEPAAPPTIDDVIPDWLLGLEEAAPAPAASDAGPGEIPDWLAALSAAEPVKAAETEPEPEPEFEPAPEPEPEPEPEPDPADVVPDWVRELSEMAAARSKPEPPPPAADPPPVEMPDWLEEFVLPGAEADDRPEPPAAPPPDWLTGAFQDEAPGGEPVDEPPSPAGAPPAWLAGALLDEPAGETSTDEEKPPLVKSDVPEWLASASWLDEEKADDALEPAQVKPAEPEPPEPEPAPSLDWLDLIAANEEVEAQKKPAEEPLASLDLDEWLGSFDFGGDDLDLPVSDALAGEDLLGLSGDLLSGEVEDEPDAGADEATAADADEMPEWMRALRQDDAPAPAPAATPRTNGREKPPQITPDPGLLERLEGLRFSEIAGDAGAGEAGTESVGALKNVSGVIQPEIIFEGSTLTVEEPVQEMIVTEEQVRQIELVKRLLAEEAAPPAAGRKPLPVLRWIVALLMLAVAALPLLPTGDVLDTLPLPEGGPGAAAAFEVVEQAARARSTVLVAFEYEPDVAPEMQPLAEAVLAHLAEGEDTVVYAISTHATGPAMAEDVLRRAAPRGRGWKNIGYLPGRATGVNSLVLGGPAHAPSAFASDHLGQPTGLGLNSLADGGIDLIVVIASQAEDVRMWVEQAGAFTGLPVVAVVSERAAPFVQPYAASGQLAGLLGGADDAVAYREMLGGDVEHALAERVSVQMAAAGLAAALIVLGALIFGLLSLREKRGHAR